jgi:hypothetical protein
VFRIRIGFNADPDPALGQCECGSRRRVSMTKNLQKVKAEKPFQFFETKKLQFAYS